MSSVRSNVSTASSTHTTVGSKRAVPKRGPMTQLDFETQRLQRMARAHQAKEQETLEKAKRQAQRSKRVAGFIIAPEKLEEQKRQRGREAAERLREGRAMSAAAKAAEEEAAREAKVAYQEKARNAGEVAKARLRERKAEERAKAARAAEDMAREDEEREYAEAEAKAARAEERRRRSQTSFFDRAADVVGAVLGQ